MSFSFALLKVMISTISPGKNSLSHLSVTLTLENICLTMSSICLEFTVCPCEAYIDLISETIYFCTERSPDISLRFARSLCHCVIFCPFSTVSPSATSILAECDTSIESTLGEVSFTRITPSEILATSPA